MSKNNLFVIAALCFLLSCSAPGPSAQYPSRAAAIAAQMHDPSTKYVVVAVHRGDWRNWPENSIPAIESVIAMEADIVEIDIHRTKDSVLVLCHDGNVLRTTNFSRVFRDQPGKSAKISDLTLEEIKMLSLKRAHGVEIDTLRMPTLRPYQRKKIYRDGYPARSQLPSQYDVHAGCGYSEARRQKTVPELL